MALSEGIGHEYRCWRCQFVSRVHSFGYAPLHAWPATKTIKTVSIERLMFSLRTISMFESTECVAPCTQDLIDVFAFLEEAHFWRRELVAGASPEHI